MITEEALKQYYQFERDFEATCKHICELLVRLSKKYAVDFDEFEVPEEDGWQGINCIYYEYCMGECEDYHEFFPVALLFMTDDEINEWIDDKLEEERQRDLAEYERIKAKYNL